MSNYVMYCMVWLVWTLYEPVKPRVASSEIREVKFLLSEAAGGVIAAAVPAIIFFADGGSLSFFIHLLNLLAIMKTVNHCWQIRPSSFGVIFIIYIGKV